MSSNASYQQLLLGAIVDSGQYRPAVQAGLTKDHFGGYENVWSYLEGYVRRMGKPPTRQILETEFPRIDLPLGQSEEVLALIYEVKEDWLQGKLSNAMRGATQSMLREGATPQTAMSFLQQELRSLSTSYELGHRDLDLLEDWEVFYQDAEGRMLARQNGEVRGIKTGFRAIDEGGGIEAGEFVTLVARSGMGKSWVAIWMAAQALMQGRNVCFFPLEMTSAQVAYRFHVVLQALSGLGGRIRNRALLKGADYDLKEYRDFLQQLLSQVQGKLIICESRRKFSPNTVFAKLQEHDPDIAFIDYLTLMSGSNGGEITDWADIRVITKELKSLASDFQIPIVTAAQANRIGATRKGPPELVDVGYGDSIGQDSDRVFSFKRVSQTVTQGRALKNRHGEDFRADFYLRHDYDRGIIKEIDEQAALDQIELDKGGDDD